MPEVVVRHRGYRIRVSRAQAMGGWENLYYSIFRIRDGRECLSRFEDSAETIDDMVGYMRQRIDGELASPDPWGHREERRRERSGHF